MLFKIAFLRLLKGDSRVPEPLLPSSTYHVVKSELLVSFYKTILSSKYVPGDLKLILNLPEFDDPFPVAVNFSRT